LSGGQRQRVAIARAIVRQPDLFLLDEPLSNLDPQLRLSTRKELKDLQRRLGITTAYVTHDQAEAMSLGDRIAILKDGRLEQVGTPEELYAAPANTFVATFVGSPGMNIIETEVCEKDGAFCAALGGGKLEICPAQALKRENVPEHTCLLGVRPEHVRFNPPDPLRPIKARVEGAERFGRDTLVHVLARNVRLCVLTAQGGPDEGKDVTVEFDPDKIHIFDRHTGKRLEVRK
jgi:multiple sugar transport system ATP-binding protein